MAQLYFGLAQQVTGRGLEPSHRQHHHSSGTNLKAISTLLPPGPFARQNSLATGLAAMMA